MATRTVMETQVPERATSRYTGVLKDEAGVVVPASSVSTLTLTLFALDASRTIVNSVSAIDILNTGRGTLDGSGNLTIVFTPADNQIVNAGVVEEAHVALIEWTSGTRGGKHEVEFSVVNYDKVS